jgi:hypothetical protein
MSKNRRNRNRGSRKDPAAAAVVEVLGEGVEVAIPPDATKLEGDDVDAIVDALVAAEPDGPTLEESTPAPIRCPGCLHPLDERIFQPQFGFDDAMITRLRANPADAPYCLECLKQCELTGHWPVPTKSVEELTGAPSVELPPPFDSASLETFAAELVNPSAEIVRVVDPPRERGKVLQTLPTGELQVNVENLFERIDDFAVGVDRLVAEASVVGVECVRLEHVLAVIIGVPLKTMRERYEFQVFPDVDEVETTALGPKVKESDPVVMILKLEVATLMWKAPAGDFTRAIQGLRPNAGLGAIADAFYNEQRAIELGRSMEGDPAQE